MEFPAQVARQEEARLARSVATHAAHTLDVAGGVACYDGPDSLANAGFGLGMEGPVSPQAIEAATSFFASHGVPARYIVCPHADPSLWQSLGAVGVIGFEHVLGRSLLVPVDPHVDHPHGWPNATLEWVDPMKDEPTDAFIDVSTASYRDPQLPVTEDLAMVTRRVMRDRAMQSLLARIDGHPAGTMQLHLHRTVGCLQSGSVLPDYRGRGLHLAMMLACFARARERGALVATAEVAPGSSAERNAVRLGFQGLYTRVVVEASA